MSSASQMSPVPQRIPLPPARVTGPLAGGPVRLHPIPLSTQARTALRLIGRRIVGAVRSTLGTGVAVVDVVLRRMRRGSERALWWLGYAQVDLIHEPAVQSPLRLPRPPHPRVIRRDSAPLLPAAVDHDDDAVTVVYGDDPLDYEKTRIALGQPGTDDEDEVTRVVPENVISLASRRSR